jgi:hypothetical protein
VCPSVLQTSAERAKCQMRAQLRAHMRACTPFEVHPSRPPSSSLLLATGRRGPRAASPAKPRGLARAGPPDAWEPQPRLATPSHDLKSWAFSSALESKYGLGCPCRPSLPNPAHRQAALSRRPCRSRSARPLPCPLARLEVPRGRGLLTQRLQALLQTHEHPEAAKRPLRRTGMGRPGLSRPGLSLARSRPGSARHLAAVGLAE